MISTGLSEIWVIMAKNDKIKIPHSYQYMVRSIAGTSVKAHFILYRSLARFYLGYFTPHFFRYDTLYTVECRLYYSYSPFLIRF